MYAINRLANFVQNAGVQKLVYMAGQENALATFYKESNPYSTYLW